MNEGVRVSVQYGFYYHYLGGQRVKLGVVSIRDDTLIHYALTKTTCTYDCILVATGEEVALVGLASCRPNT